MAIPTVAQSIIRGKISGYLAGNDNAKGNLFGGRLAAPGSILTITMVYYGLMWGSEGGAQTDASLRNVSNYLIWLCGQYGMEAQAISQGAGGGTVIPGTPSNVPNPYDWEVTALSEPLADGESSVTLDGTNGTIDYRGYNVDVLRNGVGQNTTNNGGTYFTFSRVTGLFTVFPAASSGELFRITPIG